MQIIDLSHALFNGAPSYPTDPEIVVKKEKNIPSDNSLLHSIQFGTHSGTHLDVPAHIIPNGKTISDYSLESFFGTAILINSKNYFQLSEHINNIDTVLYNTGWYKKFDDPKIFFGKNRPIIPDDLIEYVKNNNIKIFGCDLPSIDVSGSDLKPVHHALLENEIIIYESLTNLDKLPILKYFDFYGLPLSFKSLDGSPVRAAAFINI